MSARAPLVPALALVLALAPIVGEGPARADTAPSVWEIAKQPELRQVHQIHVAVQRLLAPAQLSSFDSPHHRLLLQERARALLEEAGAEQSPHVILRYDLGAVYGVLNHHEAAARVLRSALAMAPDHPASEDARLTIALAYAKLNKPEEERAAYVDYLERATFGRARVTATLNLAECEMRLGHLEEAIAGYRDAIAMANANPSAGEIGLLAQWGLAVALDRFGDTAGARSAAKWATESDHPRIIENTDTVFFVPEYERSWYLGLREIARAEAATTPDEALQHWRRADAIWGHYVDKASAPGVHDPWIARARAHKERVHARRLAAEKKRGASPPRGGAPAAAVE